MRIDLAAAIPLPAPFVLMVEPTNVCNFKCGICPESFPDYGQQAGYYQHMSMDTWRKVVDSMQGRAKVKVIRFFHTGEPLVNRNLHQMIYDARTLTERTELTTNGSLLTPERSWELVGSGLDYLRVSVYGTSDLAYRKETGSYVALDRIRRNVAELRRLRLGASNTHIHAELVTTQPGQDELFREQWAGIADTLSVKPLHNWGASLVTIGAASKKLVCPYPFYELAVKANGDVSVCCVDWSNQLVVGNVNRESLREIWEGPRLAELRAVHLRGERSKLVACRDCNVLDTCPDDLDRLVTR